MCGNCGLRLRKREVSEGTLVSLRDGDITARKRFRVNEFGESDPLPAVRAPREREVCLTRLPAIAAAF